MDMIKMALVASLLIVAVGTPTIASADCDSLRTVARIVMKTRQQTNDIDKTMRHVKMGLGCRDGDAACNAAEELVEKAFTIKRYVTTKERERAAQIFSQTYYEGCMAAQ